MTPAEFSAECRRGAEVIIKREIGAQIRDRLESLGVTGELDDVLQGLAAQLTPSVEAAMRAHLVTTKVATEQVTVIDWDKVVWPLSFDPSKITVTKSAPDQSIRFAAELARPVEKAAPAPIAAPKAPQIITVRLAPTDRDALLGAIAALKPETAGDVSITHRDGTVTTLTRGNSRAASNGPGDKARASRMGSQIPPPGPADQADARRFWHDQQTSPRNSGG